MLRGWVGLSKNRAQGRWEGNARISKFGLLEWLAGSRCWGVWASVGGLRVIGFGAASVYSVGGCRTATSRIYLPWFWFNGRFLPVFVPVVLAGEDVSWSRLLLYAAEVPLCVIFLPRFLCAALVWREIVFGQTSVMPFLVLVVSSPWDKLQYLSAPPSLI